MVNNRHPSNVASGIGGRLSTTEAKCTTSSSRRRGAAKQATTYRDNLALLRSFRTKGQLIGHNACFRNGETLDKLNYLDIKIIFGQKDGTKQERHSIRQGDQEPSQGVAQHKSRGQTEHKNSTDGNKGNVK